MKIQSRQENVIYLALWGMLFAAPVLSLYIRTINNSFLTFNWTEILIAWKLFAIYLTIFLIHNFLLAPLLIYRRKRVLYAAMMQQSSLFSWPISVVNVPNSWYKDQSPWRDIWTENTERWTENTRCQGVAMNHT